MLRPVLVIVMICSLTLPMFSQPTTKYQVGTIIEVKQHQSESNSNSDIASYDVSLQVENTIYVVLYTPPLAQNNVKYSAGRELLVLVGTDTITYNDILGLSFEVPIESRRPAMKHKSK